MLIVSCKICTKKFSVKPSHAKNGWGIYCSKKCNYLGQRTGRFFACHTCGKPVYKSLKDQSRSKSGKFFCDKACQTKWRNSIFAGENHSNWKGGQSVYRDILRRAKIERTCAKCKIGDTRVLIVHNRDRNRKNNSVSNLMWLCHNCHFLVHHY